MAICVALLTGLGFLAIAIWLAIYLVPMLMGYLG